MPASRVDPPTILPPFHYTILTDSCVYTTIQCVSRIPRGQTLPIYNRVGVLRADHRMSRARLADLVSVNPQTIGALERGDHYPSLDLAMRICAVFSLPIEAVFSRTDFAPLSAQLNPDRTSEGGTGHD